MRLRRRRPLPSPEAARLYDSAWDSYEAGQQEEGIRLLREALTLGPTSSWWFDLGLMHKWRREWQPCLDANLEAARLDPDNAPACWNGGIAATAMSQWDVARQLWVRYGIPELEGTGEPVEPLGRTPVRIDPDGNAEVVWCTRLDPARARIDNIPTPAVDRRWGDVVLHDGEPKGERRDGQGWAHVFDEILLWRRSTTPRLKVELHAPGPLDVEALEEAAHQAGWAAQDWTGGVRMLCRQCSEGRPDPSHEHPPMDDWVGRRDVGIACPEELAVPLLDAWASAAPEHRQWQDLERVD